MVFDFLNKMQPTFVRILYNSTDFSVPAKFLENLPPMHVGGRLKIRLRDTVTRKIQCLTWATWVSSAWLFCTVKPTYLHFEQIILIL